MYVCKFSWQLAINLKPLNTIQGSAWRFSVRKKSAKICVNLREYILVYEVQKLFPQISLDKRR